MTELKPYQVYKMDIDAPSILSILAPPKPPPGGRFGIVDPAWDGNDNPKVLFDGEDFISSRTYQYIGLRPSPGARVLLKSMGDSWVIVGSIIDSSRGMKVYGISGVQQNLVSTSPHYNVTLTVPDPGYSYHLMCAAHGVWQNENTGSSTPTQWDMIGVNSSDVGVTKQAIGTPNNINFGFASFVYGATAYSGAQDIRLKFVRVNGTGKISVWPGSHVGLFAIQIPV